MANRLAEATSPYLLQHADNPVDWRQWGPEAFEEARSRDVPVLLSVGYSSCHWCHVMAHESFEDPAIAELMNANYVCIKVDREERPDLDAVYMNATVATTGQGGWPMTCFLTADAKPFYCGTYYPPRPRGGMPSFPQLLEAVADTWQRRRDEVLGASDAIVAELSRAGSGLPAGAAPLDADALAGAIERVLAKEDRARGGFGGAPKFPPSALLEALIRHSERTGSPAALDTAERTADAMARGGIYDQLAGGFARYSVDADWVVPHFEKMLYDNALLLRVYAHLARRTGSGSAARVSRETAEFLIRDLGTGEGGFAAALDADTEGVEGATYVWTLEQLAEVLGEEDGRWAAQLLAVTAGGTFESGTSVLQMRRDPDDVERWRRVRARLAAARSTRPQPGRDDKVVTAWNGLAITALTEAGIALDDAALIDAAARCARHLLDRHLVDGRLRRASLGGTVGHAPAVLDDHGAFAVGLLSLYQATADAGWLGAARQIVDLALDHFADPESPGSWYDTATDSESLVVRPRDPADGATPAGASLITEALLTASVLVDEQDGERYAVAASDSLQRAAVLVQQAPQAAGHWLAVAEASIAGPLQVAVALPPEGARGELLAVARRHAPGGAVVVAGAADSAPTLRDRGPRDGVAAAYVCRGTVCQAPTTSPEALRAALDGTT